MSDHLRGVDPIRGSLMPSAFMTITFWCCSPRADAYESPDDDDPIWPNAERSGWTTVSQAEPSKNQGKRPLHLGAPVGTHSSMQAGRSRAAPAPATTT